MVSALKVILEYICPAMGTIIANVMFSAPVKSVKNAVARGYLGDLNPTPWAMALGNTCGWVLYSFLTNNLFLFFANTPGFLVSVWLNLCATKLQFQDYNVKMMRKSIVSLLEGQEYVQSDDKIAQRSSTDLATLVLQVTAQTTPAPAPHERVVMFIVLVWTIIISVVALGQNLPSRTKELIVGVCANINLFFFYGAPLSVIFKVLKERNSASIHLWTMTTNTANGAFWTAYGIAINDVFLYVPNGIGALLGVGQIILVVLFPRKDATSLEEGESTDREEQPKEEIIEEVAASNKHGNGADGSFSQNASEMEGLPPVEDQV